MEDDSTNNIIVIESLCNADCSQRREQSKLRLEVYEMLATCLAEQYFLMAE